MFCAALLAGCAPPQVPREPSAPAVDHGAWYRAAAKREPVWRIDSARSLIAVTVRRGGPFARFGHDHVVASRAISGYAAPHSGRADFQFRLDEMVVDDPALRKEASLDTEPSADAIAGTRANMLGKVLDAERHPLVLLRAEALKNKPGTMRLTVTLHGVTNKYEVPTVVETTAGLLAASGSMRLLQSDFGITPMSIMGGALSVQDQMELRFAIVAQPVPK